MDPCLTLRMNGTAPDLHLFKTYINPLIYAVIITFGLVWNGVLLVMFARHKEVRTSANIMIANLALSDVLNLSISAPLVCIYHFPHVAPLDVPSCRAHFFARIFLTSLSAMSLVALSVQRFSITVPSLYYIATSYTPTTRNILYVVCVWFMAAVVSVPFTFIPQSYEYLCGSYDDVYSRRLILSCYFAVFAVLLPSIMVTLSVLTALRLREGVPGEQRHNYQNKVRQRSATVVLTLSVLFVVSHLPFWTWCLTSYWTDLDRQSALVVVSEYVTKYCLFLDCCCNPVALFISSHTFRRLFRRYLCCARVELNRANGSFISYITPVSSLTSA